MLKLISGAQHARRAREALHRAFRRDSQRARLTLSTPDGQIKAAEILVRPDLDVWAYFAPRINRRGQWLIWFGIGKPHWQASIELNIPSRRTLHTYTQILSNDNGELYLAHKGGLGGGKFSVGPGPFGDLINGFDREAVSDNEKTKEYFILGRFAEPITLLQNVSEFVHEAERIRNLRRDQRKFEAKLKFLGGDVRKGTAIGGDEYIGESTGSGSYSVNREVKFQRIHAQVQRALAKVLKQRRHQVGDLRQKHGLGPDLYIKDRTGRMSHLFEIKVGRDSYSIFTALGQLLVYSASESRTLTRILVTRGLPRSPQFKVALDSQNIEVLTYTIENSSLVRFNNLNSLDKTTL
jgi:hypothetical protein